MWGVAVPVVNARDEAICAIGIAGPSPRLTPERVRDDVAHVHEAATVLAKALGLRVPPVSATRSSITPTKRAATKRKGRATA